MSLPGSEQAEHEIFAQWLDLMLPPLSWFHVPNEGKHKPQYRAKLKRMGLKKGVPDFVIPYARAVIELKRANKPKGRTSKDQAKWLKSFAALGWRTAVCHGADQAVERMVAWGYGKR